MHDDAQNTPVTVTLEESATRAAGGLCAGLLRVRGLDRGRVVRRNLDIAAKVMLATGLVVKGYADGAYSLEATSSVNQLVTVH